MNNLRPLALVCAGPVSRSPLGRLPHLRRNVGWVKSTSYRVASRAVDALGAGVAVSDASEMARARVWVLSVPSSDLTAALEELRTSEIDWRNRTLLILDAEAESSIAGVFRAAGAAVASFTATDTEASRYVVEGDPDAIRAVRLLLGDSHRRLVIQIKHGSKARYLAGVQAATSRALPLIAEAIGSFQSAGMSNVDAKAMTEALFTSSLRLYFRAGRRALK
jgi:hypothetical protein